MFEKLAIKLRQKRLKKSGGVRKCHICGQEWESATGFLAGAFGFAPAAASYSKGNVLGLVCTDCYRPVCKKCLKGRIPKTLPGGKCKSCGGKLGLL